MKRKAIVLLAVAATLATIQSPLPWPPLLPIANAQVESPEAIALFEAKIRPLFLERCLKCHAGEAHKAGLRLDTRAGLFQGGDTGPAVAAGNPDESLLLQAVRHQNGLAMPPDGKLSEDQISALAKWIATGAIWPEAATDIANSVATATSLEVVTVAATPPDDGELAKSLQLWLRADSLTLEDGDPVYVWPDRSGNGRDVSATKGTRVGGVGLPGTFVRESTLLRRPAVRFDTNTGLAASPDNPLAIGGDASLTIMLILNLQPHEAQPPYDGVLGIGNPANGSDPGKPLAALVQINRGEDHALHFAGGFNHDASLGPGSFKPFYGKPVILSIVKQPGPMRSTTRVFVNGEEAQGAGGEPMSGSDAVPDFQRRTDIGVYLGKALDWSGAIQGDIGEAVVFNEALSDPLRLSVEGYLADKFGMLLKPLHPSAPRAQFTPTEKGFWAYQPVQEAALPSVAHELWIKTPVDRFILAELEAQGMRPAPEADKVTLLRRATFDLTGLPPTPDEIAAFQSDTSSDAFERVVNRLLDSPHYGERWARHWLDVVRYAESTANDANAVMPYAWRYRNYVIEAFNRDLPYDQFLIEQLAGDLLPPTDSAAENARRVIATGYLMIGPKALAETDKEQSRLDIVDDQIDVTGRAMLGLTLACARCHDHKFDAIRAADYYALAGVFRSTEPFQNEVRNATMWWEFPVSQGEGQEPIVVMAPKDSAPRNLRIHVRGNRFALGAAVPRGVLEVIGQPNPIDPHQLTSGRLELARWIASPANPLTARVMVNRIWQHHFGKGLVATSDNFGARGERPTHPELLDWLAARFVESGWSIKQMHRLMMFSSVYRQSGRSDETAKGSDPDRRWLSSFPRRRLSAEELRDAVLAVSGALDRAPGADESGQYLVSKAEDIKATIRPNRVLSDDPFYTSFAKRSIYLPVVRNMLPDVLALFDAADPNNVTAQRNETTVASQSLFLLNSPLVREQSRELAERLLADGLLPQIQRIDMAHHLAFGRAATADEQAQAGEFLAAYLGSLLLRDRPEEVRQLAAWQSYCQTLLCANEFLYVE